MGSPTEHREVMRAAFKYDPERPVEDVLAEIRSRHAAPPTSSGMRHSGSKRQVAPPSHGTVRQSQLDTMQSWLTLARDRNAGSG